MLYISRMQKIGIYQDGSQLKVAALSHEQLIEHLGQPSLFSEEEWPGLLVSGIDGDKVLVRHIESPLKKKRALQKTLPFQLENLISFAFSETIVRPIYQVGKEKTKATFFVVSQKNLAKHLASFEGLDPSWVSCLPMALYRFACFTRQDKEGYIIFHVGRKATEIVSVAHGMVQHNLSIGIGIEQLEAAYQADRPTEKESKQTHSIRRLDLLALNPKNYPHLTGRLQEFQREVDRSFCFLNYKQDANALKFLLFTGETDTSFQLEDWIKGWETFSYEILPIAGHRGYDAQMVKTYAVPIGLALDAVKQDQKSIQFRQGEWISPDVYRRIKTKVVKGVALCLASAAALFIVGHVIYTKKEKTFVREIDHFAKTYKKEIPALEKVAFAETTQDKLQFLNRHIKVVKNDYGYFSPPPLVADVLAFLSEHPKLNRQEGEKKMVVEHLQYQLVNYPSIQEPYQSYKVKVSVIFTSPESTWAREFHDAIVENTDWVNEEEAITWAREQNVYTLSFILK